MFGQNPSLQDLSYITSGVGHLPVRQTGTGPRFELEKNEDVDVALSVGGDNAEIKPDKNEGPGKPRGYRANGEFLTSA